MAYALQEDDEFKSSWQPQQVQLGGAPASGAVGTPTPAAGAAASPPGSRFISFDRYLGANSEAAAKTGEKLGYGVQQKGDDAKRAMDTGLVDFQAAAIKGMGGADRLTQPVSGVGGPTNKTLPPSGPASVGGAVGPGAQTQGTPSGVAGPVGGQSLAAATKLASGTYTGPTSLGEFRPELRGQVEGAQRTAKQLGTEEGRRALLMEGMGRQPGAYSGAMAGLDEALATGSGTNRDRFARTSDVYGKLNEWLGHREADATRTADFARTGTQRVADKFSGLLKDYKTMGETAQGAQGAGGPAVRAEQFVDNFMQNGAVSSAFRPVLQDWIAKNGRTPSEEEVNQLFTGFQGAF